jgi:tetratricopeptide (TPR) repeat protein
MRQAVSEQLNPIRRQLLHRRTAMALSHHAVPAATLAYHWYHAGDEAQEGYYAALAGEAAAAQFAHEEAVTYLQRARQLLSERRRRVEVMLVLGGVWRLNGRWPEAETVYREAITMTEGHKQSADAQAALGNFLAVRGEYEEAKTWLRRAKAAYEAEGDLVQQAHILDGLGMIHWRQGALPQALAEVQQAQTLARQSKDLKVIGKVMGNLGVVHWSLGAYEEALRCLEERLVLAEQLGDRLARGKAIGNIGLVYMEQGRYVPALTKATEKYQLERELDNRRSMGIALGNMGLAYLRCGAWRRALVCHFRQLEIALMLGDRWGITLAAANLLDMYIAQANYAEARRFSERVIALARVLNIPYYLCHFLAKGALIAQHEENLAEAVALADEAWEMVQAVGRREVLFEVELLRLRLAAQQEVTGVDTAVSHLQTSLQKWTDPAQQAQLWDALWQLDNSRRDWAQAAVEGYRALYDERPDFEYRKRYRALTGERLPPPPVLPDLPSDLADVVVDLTAVLHELDAVIAG